MNSSNYCKRHLKSVLLLLILISVNGCLRRYVKNTVTDLTDALYQQRDVQLAREGSAAFILVTDGLIQSRFTDPDALLMGVQTYTAYASAFAVGIDDSRAHRLLDQALEYGLKMWQLRFGWPEVRTINLDKWISELRTCSQEDVPYLFWTANAWSTWIATHPDKTLATADLSYVVETMKRILELDSSYQDGAVHLFFGTYYAVQPRGLGRDLDKSRSHYEKAIHLAGTHAMLPKTLYARYYARALFDEELFRTTLESVLNSPEPCKVPGLNLMNAIARERAATYLDQIDDLF